MGRGGGGGGITLALGGVMGKVTGRWLRRDGGTGGGGGTGLPALVPYNREEGLLMCAYSLNSKGKVIKGKGIKAKIARKTKKRVHLRAGAKSRANAMKVY